MRRHERDELRADRGVGADACAAVADHAVDRGPQLGVAQIELREVTLGDRLVQRRPGLLLLRVDDIEPVPRRGERRPRFLDGGACLLVVRIGLLKTLERGVLVGGEPAVARYIEPGSRDLGLRRCDLGLSLRDHRYLQAAGRVEIGQSGLLRSNRRIRLGHSGAVVPVVQLNQQIPGVDRLIVRDRQLGDEAGYFRRDHRHVAADIGIVGALDEAANRPPLMAIPRSTRSDHECEAVKHDPPQSDASDCTLQIAVRRYGSDASLSGTDVEFGYGSGHRVVVRRSERICAHIGASAPLSTSVGIAATPCSPASAPTTLIRSPWRLIWPRSRPCWITSSSMCATASTRRCVAFDPSSSS